VNETGRDAEGCDNRHLPGEYDENFSKNTSCPGQDSNRRPSECKSETSPFEVTFLVAGLTPKKPIIVTNAIIQTKLMQREYHTWMPPTCEPKTDNAWTVESLTISASRTMPLLYTLRFSSCALHAMT
jgi:hypothetical protein